MRNLRSTGGPLRWGLMASGGIARKFAVDARAHGIEVAAVASRDPARAADFAARHGIPRSHGSYDALLADPDVDAIYIAIPSNMHAEWSIRAARAGKHILCEKPGAMDEAECEAVIRAVERAGVFYMEGFMYRCHPIWGLVKALIAEDRIGEVKSLRSSFCYDMGEKPENIRQRKDTGGGALLDVGCYCLSFIRMIAGSEPISLRATSRLGAESGVDELTTAELKFTGGLTASFQCAMRLAEPHAAIIHGGLGRIEIPTPWHPPAEGAEVRLLIDGEEPEIYRTGDGLALFAREALDVAENLGSLQSPSMNWLDSLGQARAMGALRKSAGL